MPGVLKAAAAAAWQNREIEYRAHSAHVGLHA